MLSLIANRSLATKIIASFVLILAITAAVGTAGILFTQVLRDRMGRTADLAATMTSMQGVVADVTAYAGTGDAATARKVDAGLEGLKARLDADLAGSDGDKAALLQTASGAVSAMREHLAKAVDYRAQQVATADKIDVALKALAARGMSLEDVATKTAKEAANAESVAKQAVKDAARLIGAMRDVSAALDRLEERFSQLPSAADAEALAASDVAKALRKANGAVPKDAPATLDQVKTGVAAAQAAAKAAIEAGGSRPAVLAAVTAARETVALLSDHAGKRVSEAATPFTDLAAKTVASAGISTGSVKLSAQTRKLALDVATFRGDIRMDTVRSVRAQIEAVAQIADILSQDGAAIAAVASTGAEIKPLLTGLSTDVQAMRDANGWFVAHLADVRVRLADAMGAMNALVTMEQSGAASDQSTASAGILSALAAAVVLAALIGLGLVLVIRRPIRALTTAMQRLASGDTDASLDGLARRDEIGDMTRAVVVFRDNALERMRLEQAAAAEQAAREARNARVVEMIQDFEARTGDLLAAVSASGGTLQHTADQLETIAEGTADRARSASGATGEASGNVQTVASAAEELASSIEEISRQVLHTKSVVDQAVERAKLTNASMTGLSDMASRIGDVVALIKAVADQTNLLALNATIEAARAGDAGKGFAVVAQEVKGLAKQTADATEEISRQIAEIQKATAESVGAIATITATMDEIGSHTTGIAAAVEEQGAATSEISANIQRIAGGTRVVVNDMERLTASASQTSTMSGAVLKASADMTDAAGNLKAAIQAFLRDVAA